MLDSVSVVVATYNRAALLAECLEALRTQDYLPGDELIVVNNASTDATSDVLTRAAAAFPVPLLQLRETAPGKTPALMTGVAAARGAILAFTDDDVMVGPDWIATMRRLFEDSSLALAGGRVDPRWERPAPRWLRVDQEGRYGRMTSPLALLHYGEPQPLGARTAVGANLAVRRDAFDAIGGFSSHLGRFRGTLLCGEDRDLCERVAAAGFRCEYRPELRVRHWVPSERMRLGYYLRWFFWSGVTDARMRVPGRARGLEGHFWRRLLIAPWSLARAIASRRAGAGTSAAIDAAFAAGYVTECLRRRMAGLRTARGDDSSGASDPEQTGALGARSRAWRC